MKPGISLAKGLPAGTLTQNSRRRSVLSFSGGLFRRGRASARFDCGDLLPEFGIHPDLSRLHGNWRKNESPRGSSKRALHHAEGSNGDMEIVRVRLRPVRPAGDQHRFIGTPQMPMNR